VDVGVAFSRGLEERRAEESGAENGNFGEHVFSGLKEGCLIGRFSPFSKQTIRGCPSGCPPSLQENQ
jgi:hypothetical protein